MATEKTMVRRLGVSLFMATSLATFTPPHVSAEDRIMAIEAAVGRIKVRVNRGRRDADIARDAAIILNNLAGILDEDQP